MSLSSLSLSSSDLSPLPLFIPFPSFIPPNYIPPPPPPPPPPSLSLTHSDDIARTWHSGPIVERLASRELSTRSGTVYFLEGPMDGAGFEKAGVGELAGKFQSGFPKDWRDIIHQFLAQKIEVMYVPPPPPSTHLPPSLSPTLSLPSSLSPLPSLSLLHPTSLSLPHPTSLPHLFPL